MIYAELYHRGLRTPTVPKLLCETCGRSGHHRNDCHYFMNDMCNNTHKSWEDSAVVMASKRKGHFHFKPGVKLHNCNMATNTKGKMLVNWAYPKEEDNIVTTYRGSIRRQRTATTALRGQVRL